MGDYLTVSQFSDDMQLVWDKKIAIGASAGDDYVEVANTERHRWAVGQLVRLENQDGYSEDREVKTVVYGTGATLTKITMTAAITTKANFTVAKAGTIQIKSYFTELTFPSSATIERWIDQAEAKIDNFTRRSWKTKTWEGYLPWDPTAIRVATGELAERYLFHVPVKKIVTPLVNGTDSLKIWTGTAEEEKLGTWVEGRARDYWVDSINGDLMLISYRPRVSRRSVYLKCRYTEGTVPDDIVQACSLLVQKTFLRSDRRNIEGSSKPQTGEQWPYNSGQPSWKEIEALMRPYRRDVVGAV